MQITILDWLLLKFEEKVSQIYDIWSSGGWKHKIKNHIIHFANHTSEIYKIFYFGWECKKLFLRKKCKNSDI